jgi:sugar phosphate isomerase/epimerase
MKLGVAGIVSEWSQIDAAGARKVREYGFRGLSVFFSRPLEADLQKVKALKPVLDDAGLETAQANGWYEALVNPDDALRAEGVRGLEALCRAGRVLDAETVYVRPGGLNPRGHWYAHPDNQTPQTFDRLVDSMRKASSTAQAEGMRLAIEGHVLSVLDTARKIRDLLDAVGSPALKFNVDAVNFIGTVRDVHNTRPILKEMFDLLGKDTIAAHMKDLAIQDELVLNIQEVVIGTGSLDQEYYLELCQEYCPDIYCLIEHLPEEKVPLARTGLLKAAANARIQLEF